MNDKARRQTFAGKGGIFSCFMILSQRDRQNPDKESDYSKNIFGETVKK